MLSKSKHQLVLKQLLREIFTDSELSAQLVFKGGTSLMLFYDLDRFSTDLDFDLRGETKEIDFERLQRLAASQLTIKDWATKKNTYLLEGSYEIGMQQIKIEVSRRLYPQAITLQGFLGLSIPVLSNEYLLAHKLCAITSRKAILGRDIYDADFMFKRNWEPNAEIVRLRTGLSLPDYYKELLQTTSAPAVEKRLMLGLGEVLEQKARGWAQANLLKSFREQLMLRA
jgi:predicted nucleotidyltransferase component of viral defense system